MRPLPPDALKCVRQYLTASAPPFDFGSLYDVTADDALLLVGGHAIRRHEVSRELYAAQMVRWRATRPGMDASPSFSLLKMLDWQPDDAGGSLLMSLKEQGSGQTVMATFRLAGPAWRIQGACLQGKTLADPATVTARCRAEFAAWAPQDGHPFWPVSGLALSFLRQTAMAGETLLSLPEARFTCQDRGDCCRMAGAWDIAVDSNVERALGDLDWSALGWRGPRFETRNAKRVQAEETASRLFRLGACDNGDCRAHQDGRCSVHQTVGWQPIEFCDIFPYQFVATPDGICVTTSFFCHTVGENVGQPLTAAPAGVQAKLARVRPHVAILGDEIPLGPGAGVLTWPAWRLIEDRLLAILADRTLGTIHDRVRRGTQTVAALVAICIERDHTDEPVVADILETALPDLRPYPSQRADDMMLLLLRRPPITAAHSPFAGGRLAAWKQGKGQPLGDRLDDELVTRYLRTVLYRKLGLDPGGLAFAWGTVAWAARAWERQTILLSETRGVPVDRQLQLETARHLDFGLLQEGYLQAFLYQDRVQAHFVDPRTWIALGAL